MLKNTKSNELYYGYTNDISRRTRDHLKENPNYSLIYYEAYISEQDARQRERMLKQYGQARTHLKNRLKDSLSSKISAGSNSGIDLRSLTFRKSSRHWRRSL